MTDAARFYDMQERLTWSHGFLDEGIEQILLGRVPACVKVEQATEKDDRQGTDYWAYRRGDLRPLSVDVKIREKDYAKLGHDDLALETWSVIGKSAGWTRDSTKRTDFVLWFWQDTGRFFLASFPSLCCVFERYWEVWRQTYKHAVQSSGTWHSECVFVPRHIVMDRMGAWANGKAE